MLPAPPPRQLRPCGSGALYFHFSPSAGRSRQHPLAAPSPAALPPRVLERGCPRLAPGVGGAGCAPGGGEVPLPGAELLPGSHLYFRSTWPSLSGLFPWASRCWSNSAPRPFPGGGGAPALPGAFTKAPPRPSPRMRTGGSEKHQTLSRLLFYVSVFPERV